MRQKGVLKHERARTVRAPYLSSLEPVPVGSRGGATVVFVGVSAMGRDEDALRMGGGLATDFDSEWLPYPRTFSRFRGNRFEGTSKN
jgi:hypothetical protein